MKSKTLTLAISVFALLAIISVGFASWVISRNDQTGDIEGSIQVDDVKDEGLGISYRWLNAAGEAVANPLIAYGVPTKTKPEVVEWLKNETATAENLTVVLEISVENQEALANKNVTVTFSVKNKTTTFDEQNGKSFVLPFGTETTKTYKQENFTNGVLKVTLEFRWGSDFGGFNPLGENSIFGAYNKTDADKVSAALTALYTALNGVTYGVSVAATPAA